MEGCCRFLEIDPKAWPGVEKTAATSDPKHHIGAVRVVLHCIYINPHLPFPCDIT